MSGYVYFVQHGEFGPIKIGFTSCNVGGRFSQLQRAAPDLLVFRGYMHGGQDLEQQLHKRFAPWLHRGEWFKPNDELVNFIAAEAITDSIDVVLRKDLRAAIHRSRIAKWPKEVQAAFNPYAGEQGPLVSAWREGAAVPSERMVQYYEGFLTKHNLWPTQDAEVPA